MVYGSAFCIALKYLIIQLFTLLRSTGAGMDFPKSHFAGFLGEYEPLGFILI